MSLGTCGGVTDGIAYARSRAATNAGRGGVDVPRRPEDRHPMGEGRQTQRYSYVGWAPSLPGVGGSRPAAGANSHAASGRLTNEPQSTERSSQGASAGEGDRPFFVPSAGVIITYNGIN